VKTNVIFFDKTHATKEIRYYEVDPGRKLTKNKPIRYSELTERVEMYKDKPTNDKAWVVKMEDIVDSDISAKNPAKIVEIIHRDPQEILADIKATDEKILVERKKLEEMLG